MKRFDSAELKPLPMEYHDWMSILGLSTLWRMRFLRILCVLRMSPLPTHITPLEKVLMARKYMIGDWLVDAFDELLWRDEVLTDEEVDGLDSTTVVKLLWIQERRLKNKNGSTPLKEVIRDTFQRELQRFDEYDLDSEDVGHFPDLNRSAVRLHIHHQLSLLR
jgi:hypothetical protein